MRILFALNTLGFLRHFDRALIDLSRRGHSIILAITDRGDTGQELPSELQGVKGLEVVDAPFQRDASLREPVRVLRSFRDYLRYHEPQFERQTSYRARALERFLQATSGGSRPFDESMGSAFAGLTTLEVDRARRSLQALEDLVPSAPIYERFIESEAPDAVLVTPLIMFASPLVDMVKSAQHLSIPVGFPVFSWDNLSTKGVIHVAPDKLFVWNDVQKREAVELHGIGPERVSVTGAARFDDFFEGGPSETREALCTRLGLDASRPIVTYLGSSPFVSPNETEFVDLWVDHLRNAAGTTARTANVLIRPHPRSETLWRAWQSSRWPGVGVYATDRLGDHALYDCVYHADAVVAINTSAQLEAGILGKPVLTVLAPAFAPGQQGSMHFDYLLAENGGHVEVAADLDQHVVQLESALKGGFDADRCRRFIETFVRPAGLDQPASPILADAIEQWMTDSVSPARAAPARFSRLRQRLGAAVAGGRIVDTANDTDVANIADAAALTRVVRTRVRRERNRSKLWKQQVISLRAELDQLRGGESSDATREPAPPPASTVDRERGVADVDYPHAKVQIFVTSRAERRWRAHVCAKEPWTTAWLDEQVQPGDIVFDIGANVGVFSLIAASRLDGDGLVVAFEPGYANYARLCENIVLNHVEASVVPVPVPLSDSNSLQSFTYHSREPGQSRHTFTGERWSRSDPAGRRYTQPMLGMKLDDLVQQFELPTPTHVKLDVDGAEVQVLRGAASTLADPSVRTLMIEVDVAVGDEVVRRLESMGLRLKSRHEHPRDDRASKTWYGLFARASSN